MQLFFRHYGSGRPLVILHGLFGVSDNWVTLGKSFAQDYSVWLPDLRNHGQSPHSPVFDFPSLCDDLLNFFEEHNLQDVYLVGHSLGGKTAMNFVLQYPGFVRKLVIVDISLRRSPPRGDHQRLLNAMMNVDFSATRSRSDVEKQLAGEIDSPAIRQFLLKNVYWRDRQTLDWRLNLHAINQNLLSVFEAVTQPSVFAGPSLFIRGGNSDYILDDDLPMIKAKFPGASVRTIANASHWVHADAPGEFFRIVTEFLADP